MGLSVGHLLILLLISLVFFGPRIPGLGTALGKGLLGFKKALDQEKNKSDEKDS